VDALSGSRPGEVFAGFQAVALPGEGHKPTVNLSYVRRLYASPAPEIDIGTFKNNALILVSDDLAGFHFDINGIVSEQTKGIIPAGNSARPSRFRTRWDGRQSQVNFGTSRSYSPAEMPSGICGTSRIRSGKILCWTPDSTMASPLPRRSGKGLRASRTFCLTDCGGSTIQNKYHLTRLSLPHLQWFKRRRWNKNRASNVINSD